MRLRQFLTTLGVALFGAVLPATSVLAQPRDGDAGEFRILEARYGTASANIDVTERLRELARQDQQLKIENKLFGNDPAPGRVKTLRIYARTPDGSTRIFEFEEGGFVDGAQFSGWNRGEWTRGGWNGGWGGPAFGAGGGRPGGGDSGAYRILQARYGLASRNIDVTDRLRELARQDQNFKVDNKLFGDDPAPGRVKMLRIYARGPGGAPRMFEYREGGFVDGSQFSGWGGGDWGRDRWNGGWGGESAGGRPDDGVRIDRATYGSGRQTRDVTERIRSLARDGRLDIGVDNDTIGSDPAPGRRKQLIVVYSIGRGQQQEKRASEQERMQLP